MIQKLDLIMTLQNLCKATKKWGMFLNIYRVDWDKVVDPHGIGDPPVHGAPYLTSADLQLIAHKHGFLLFDSEEECYECFWNTVGDDGPTVTNPYSGPERVYALVCNPEGELQNENT